MAFVTLETAHWNLEVWARDDAITAARERIASTFSARGCEPPPQRTRVREYDPLSGEVRTRDIDSAELMFFENRLYDFEFTFTTDQPVTVRHRRRSVEEAFRTRGRRHTASINFGNDVGWFHLELHFETPSGPRVESVSLEVHPTKLDMERDLRAIHERVDASYPLWRFSFAQSTEQRVARVTRPHERLPLLWIEQFRQLRDELDRGVRVVCNAPHQRIIESSRAVRVDSLRGRLSPRREEQVAERLLVGDTARRVQQSTRTLTVDTPENRFVRDVLERCDREIGRFSQRVDDAARRDGGAISESARRELDGWRSAVRDRLAHGLFRAVSSSRALLGESQVLHQRAGYAGVYRVWQQLQMYFEVLGRDASISMKTVAELYEVWCLLALRETLRALGFEEEERDRPRLDARGPEVLLGADGMGAAFCFQRGTTRVRLAHEPVYRRYSDRLRDRETLSWLSEQRPDFVLEATFGNGERLLWVFDAKYRVQRRDESSDERDRAPDDAINQMHRYRDAIVRCERASEDPPRLSRPVVGAFVLFPGWFPEDAQSGSKRNPYQDAIDAVGIGAFPLLPGQKNPWLHTFLESQLCPVESTIAATTPDAQLAQHATRIVTSGLRARRDADLVFIAHAAAPQGRSPEYVNAFKTGEARWFHVYDVALERGRLTAAMMADVTRCAVAVRGDDGYELRHIYDVRSIRRVDRREITPAQSGTATPAREGLCWLFELGAPVTRSPPLRVPRRPRYTAHVATWERLLSARTWSDLDDRYSPPR